MVVATTLLLLQAVFIVSRQYKKVAEIRGQDSCVDVLSTVPNSGKCVESSIFWWQCLVDLGGSHQLIVHNQNWIEKNSLVGRNEYMYLAVLSINVLP